MLAFRPFLDPIDVTSFWYLLMVPMALLIAIAYKAVRMPQAESGPLRPYIIAVLKMTAMIVFWMIALWVAFYFFVLKLLPTIAPMPGLP